MKPQREENIFKMF